MHKKSVVVDGHCDTVHLFLGTQGPYSFGELNAVGQADLPRLRSGGVNLQFFAVYIEPEFKPHGALQRTLFLVEHFWREMGKHSKDVVVVKNKADLGVVKNTSKIGALLALEGAEPLENVEMLHILYRLGLRSVGLTWNQRNLLADGVGVGASAGGLTPLGKAMVTEMNSLGIMVDAAHLAPKGFFDLLETVSAPPIVTHANAASLCAHRRNLSDEQLRALSEQGGVVGLTYYPPFVSEQKDATLEDLLDHFCYIAERFGTSVLGLGSDFDGIPRAVQGLEDVSKLPRLTEGLIRRGFSAEEISAILGGNFLRVLQACLPQEETDEDSC
ncbi:dipeptidase [Dethiobacter alkaliphilus]|uniref:dipeptidase n=1 Tax=Dethiobacter alkaliphilus TaxID=427926 RepID=UPI00058FA35F|nr:dipeptidase [Dethiobacter alkaliphilus]